MKRDPMNYEPFAKLPPRAKEETHDPDRPMWNFLRDTKTLSCELLNDALAKRTVALGLAFVDSPACAGDMLADPDSCALAHMKKRLERMTKRYADMTDRRKLFSVLKAHTGSVEF